MSKKRTREDELPVAKPPAVDSPNAGSDDDEDFDMVNVDFEWFGFEEVDFHGVKMLLRQLFDVDAALFDLSAVTDHILQQTALGSTVKCDGRDSDPYAFCSVLPATLDPAQNILTYLQQRTESSASNVTQTLAQLLLSHEQQQQPTKKNRVGLLLSERMINMPTDIVPTTLTSLLDELAAADPQNTPPYTHFVIPSKAYREVASSVADDESGQEREMKKKKKDGDAAASTSPLYYFHAEDEILQAHALAHGSFTYARAADAAAADSKRAFHELGIQPCGHVVVIEAARLREAITALEKAIRGQ